MILHNPIPTTKEELMVAIVYLIVIGTFLFVARLSIATNIKERY